jgi:Tol biopolymer transport system component
VEVTWAWSPDGRSIAASIPAGANRYDLAVFSADGSNRRVLTTTAERGINSINWSSDGGQIYFSRLDSLLRSEHVVVSASGGAVQPSPFARPSYSPDGRMIAYRRVAGASVEIVLRDAASNTERVVGTFAGFAAAWGPTWSPDGRRIAVAGTLGNGAGHVAVLDATNATATFREINDVTGDAFAWSPDSTEIATSVFDGPAPRAGGTRRMNLVAVNATTNRRRVLVRADRGACRAYQPTWSATGLGFVHQCAPPAATETRVIRLP